ncbi:MAG: ankyrin repeat domain-containing protein [Alphaproteobacteria bacterium]|nr:ankyrin repeat domain-containing protein [Alphaproteobacteria bacterium]
MKLTGILSAYCVCCAVALSAYADADFDKAAKLLSAAKNANIQQVQSLISSGANVNYVDPTGLSLVCTALMNNDTRAFQILQMYGADASQCDIQIKQYKNRTTVKGSDGVFGGLSTPQTLTLAAGGAALVGGGVALVAGVFNPSNNNGNAGGGSRPDSGGGGGGGGDNLKPEFTIPYGPQSDNEDDFLVSDAHKADFNYFRPGQEGVETETYYTDHVTPLQNYLLIMHGYSPFSRGYMGQTTFRDGNNAPVKILNGTGGGVPIIVSMITNNGLNLTGSLGRASGIAYADSAAADANTYIVDKYLNFENPTIIKEEGGYDLSGSGTVFNPWATPDDSALGKIIAGWEADERSVADLYGFIPNGRLAVYRTGGGQSWVNVTNPISVGEVAMLTKGSGNTENYVQAGDTIIINGRGYEIVRALDASTSGTNPTITISGTIYKVAADSEMLVAKDADDIAFAFYRDTDGFYYINDNGGNTANKVFYLDPNKDSETNMYKFYNGKTLESSAFDTFKAMYTARSDGAAVIANLTINPKARESNYLNISGIKNYFATEIAKEPKKTDIDIFKRSISEYYDASYDPNSTVANVYPGDYADILFKVSPSSIIIMPAGEFKFGLGKYESTSVLDATFENYAPALYSNLDHKFMTVVAVQHATDDIMQQSTISGYGNGVSSGVLYLATHDDFVSRKCGVAGTGVGSADPWCFAAAGPTAEMATASAAGAVAAVKGAFGKFLSNDQVFTLLALTADGAYLAYDDAGNKYTEDTLRNYLQSMYSLPQDYYITKETPSSDYLKAFKDVYGYGLINLERATTPGKSIYYFDGTRIVSVNNDKNAYWRAAVDTSFNLTGPFGARGATISASFYDVLTSIDGEMSLPRVWENEITLGSDSVHALYMGDVLGDLKTRKDSAQKTKIGNISLSMAISDRPYADNLGGLDNLGFAYENDRFNLNADFQRYFTDGQSRFTGMANPILALTADTISTGAEYKIGNFFVGGRAFSGAITDEAFLQNDPTISSQYQSLSLGVAQGAMSQFGWNNKKLSLVGSVGFMHESNTVLGAQTDGLLGIGNGNTTYFDMLARYDVTDNVSLSLRSTFAQTKTDPTGMFINDVSDLNSNAFAFGANLGNFEFTVSRPLAIYSGALRYAYADYDIVDNGNGKYDLSVSGAGLRDLSLAPDVRETRFSGTYRHSFGEFTDGALGFIYRVNPNNTNQFGNESIFMLKLTHRLGI